MGDTSKHITSFKLKNFKRFESFEMNDLGQFNLIVGDNNVGKTSVLEALLVDEFGQYTIPNFLAALRFKKLVTNSKVKDIEYFINRQKSLGQRSLFVSFDLNSNIERHVSLEFNIENQKVTVKRSLSDFDQFDFHMGIGYASKLPFIPFYKGHDSDLTNYYSEVIQKNRSLQRRLVDAMKIMLPDFESIELSAPYPDQPPHLIISEKNNDATLPLAMYGEGTIKLFRLLIEIVINQGGRLMIDEIDTGIHFSRYKEFWKIILRAANNNNVQLFMTTHNEECIKYFKEVLENDLSELQKNSRSITLVETPKTKEVQAFTYTFTQLEANIDVGNEIRGGVR